MSKITRNGLGFFAALTISFIALKRFEVIDWGWGWVLMPVWFPILISTALIVLVVVSEQKQKKCTHEHENLQ